MLAPDHKRCEVLAQVHGYLLGLPLRYLPTIRTFQLPHRLIE